MSLGIILVLAGVAGLVWAVRRSDPPRGSDPSGSSARLGWRDGLMGLTVTVLWIGALWALADLTGWSRDRTLWLGLGSFVATMTLLRPRWYWENYRARWLRDTIGDGATAAFYLVVAALMIGVGLFTRLTFGRR